MKTSRQRIYEYIRAQRAVTIGELSVALQSSEANIRHHLGILQEQGLVSVTGERPASGKGRPAQVFGPSAQILGNNLDLLADALLAEIEASLPEEVRQKMIDCVSERLGATLRGGSPAAGEGQAGRSAAGAGPLRLIQTIHQLNEHHYQARWEPRPDGPRIILGHCPYMAVIEGHPWLCEMDAGLLERLLGQPVEQIERLVQDGLRGKQCVFRVRPAFDI
jgi:predicted ArsR family transcriptional regulator